MGHVQETNFVYDDHYDTLTILLVYNEVYLFRVTESMGRSEELLRELPDRGSFERCDH